MSYTGALTRARSLKTALLDHGVRAVSIELQQGRPGTPNDAWYDTRFEAEMSHHTASYPSQGDTPCLALVKKGRSDVPGPLCNGYMGYDRIYRIICMGWANHPGAGGPLTVAGFTIPQDGARPYAWGTEFEGGYLDWSDAMHEAMSRANAGILDWLNEPLEAHIEHKTWAPTRKVDRRGYTATSGRAAIKPYMGGAAAPTTPEDDMPYTPEQLTQIVKNAIDAMKGDLTQNAANGVARALDGTQVPAQLRKALLVDTTVRRGTNPDGTPILVPLVQEIADAKTAALKAAGLEVDEAEIAASVGAILLPIVQSAVTDALAEVDGVDEQAVAQAVVDEIAGRLASTA